MRPQSLIETLSLSISLSHTHTQTQGSPRYVPLSGLAPPPTGSFSNALSRYHSPNGGSPDMPDGPSPEEFTYTHPNFPHFLRAFLPSNNGRINQFVTVFLDRAADPRQPYIPLHTINGSTPDGSSSFRATLLPQKMVSLCEFLVTDANGCRRKSAQLLGYLATHHSR